MKNSVMKLVLMFAMLFTIAGLSSKIEDDREARILAEAEYEALLDAHYILEEENAALIFEVDELSKANEELQKQNSHLREEMKKMKEEWIELGTFKITHYCHCSICSGSWGKTTSTGTVPQEGRTIAVDPKVIPYGSEVKIDNKIYIAEDCGGAIKNKRIDIYVGNHAEAMRLGVKHLDVKIRNN